MWDLICWTMKFVSHYCAKCCRWWDTRRNLLRAICRGRTRFYGCNIARTKFGVDTRCNSAIARNIAPCIRTFSRPISRSVGRSFSQSINQSINQSIRITEQLNYGQRNQYWGTKLSHFIWAIVFQVSVQVLCMADGVTLETGVTAVYRVEAE